MIDYMDELTRDVWSGRERIEERMAQTPEGKVKATVKKVLSAFSEHGIYYNMPVPTGYGTPTLDFIGCFHGRFFAIETKTPGKKPTPRQRLTIEQMQEAGGMVFVIDGDTTELENWLNATADRHGAP